LSHLLGNKEAVLLVTDKQRISNAVGSIQPGHRFLQQRSFARKS
jgi:hypothetical protein